MVRANPTFASSIFSLDTAAAASKTYAVYPRRTSAVTEREAETRRSTPTYVSNVFNLPQQKYQGIRRICNMSNDTSAQKSSGWEKISQGLTRDDTKGNLRAWFGKGKRHSTGTAPTSPTPKEDANCILSSDAMCARAFKRKTVTSNIVGSQARSEEARKTETMNRRLDQLKSDGLKSAFRAEKEPVKEAKKIFHQEMKPLTMLNMVGREAFGPNSYQRKRVCPQSLSARARSTEFTHDPAESDTTPQGHMHVSIRKQVVNAYDKHYNPGSNLGHGLCRTDTKQNLREHFARGKKTKQHTRIEINRPRGRMHFEPQTRTTRTVAS